MPPFGRRNRRREPYAWIADGGAGHVLGNIPQGGNPVAATEVTPEGAAAAVGARGGPSGRLFDEAGRALGAAPPGAVVRVRGGAGEPAGEPARAAGGRAAAERRAERAMERAAERAMERAVEGPAERAMERRVEGPVERAVMGGGGDGGGQHLPWPGYPNDPRHPGDQEDHGGPGDGGYGGLPDQVVYGGYGAGYDGQGGHGQGYQQHHQYANEVEYEEHRRQRRRERHERRRGRHEQQPGEPQEHCAQCQAQGLVPRPGPGAYLVDGRREDCAECRALGLAGPPGHHGGGGHGRGGYGGGHGGGQMQGGYGPPGQGPLGHANNPYGNIHEGARPRPGFIHRLGVRGGAGEPDAAGPGNNVYAPPGPDDLRRARNQHAGRGGFGIFGGAPGPVRGAGRGRGHGYGMQGGLGGGGGRGRGRDEGDDGRDVAEWLRNDDYGDDRNFRRFVRRRVGDQTRVVSCAATEGAQGSSWGA